MMRVKMCYLYICFFVLNFIARCIVHLSGDVETSCFFV